MSNQSSQGKNIISRQFIVWKSHKQTWPANRGESEVMVTRPIRWEEPLQNCIENKGRRINKYLTAIMTLPFAGANCNNLHQKITQKMFKSKSVTFNI